MSWHYLQGSEAVSWQGTISDGLPDALSKLIPTPGPYSSPGRETGPCLDSRFGTIYAHSMEAHGEATSISSPADSRARTSAVLGVRRGSQGPDRGSGDRWPESFARWDQDSSSWKTPQILLFEGSIGCSVIWPRWGSMRSGACYLRAPLVLHTHASGCSLWPTPTAYMGRRGWANGKPGKGRYNAELIQRCKLIGWTPSPQMQEALMGLPIGWTDCDVLATRRSQSKQKEHG